MRGVHWTDAEDTVLRAWYPSLGPRGVAAKLPRRSANAICQRAYAFGLAVKRTPAAKTYPGNDGHAVKPLVRTLLFSPSTPAPTNRAS